MEAIANVVMNRIGHEGFPKTICKVVMQGREQGACQFSWLPCYFKKAKDILRYLLKKPLTDFPGVLQSRKT